MKNLSTKIRDHHPVVGGTYKSVGTGELSPCREYLLSFPRLAISLWKGNTTLWICRQPVLLATVHGLDHWTIYDFFLFSVLLLFVFFVVSAILFACLVFRSLGEKGEENKQEKVNTEKCKGYNYTYNGACICILMLGKDWVDTTGRYC